MIRIRLLTNIIFLVIRKSVHGIVYLIVTESKLSLRDFKYEEVNIRISQRAKSVHKT